MSKITLPHDVVQSIVLRYERRGIKDAKVTALLNKHVRGQVSINLNEAPLFLIRGLLFNRSLTPKQRAALTKAAMKNDPMQAPVTDPGQFHTAIMTGLIEKALQNEKLAARPPQEIDDDDPDYDDYEDDDPFFDDAAVGICAEAEINGKYYPIALRSVFINDVFFTAVMLTADAWVWDMQYHFEWWVTGQDFLDIAGRERPAAPVDVLRSKGIRLLTTDIGEFKAKVEKADELGKRHGTVLSVTGPALVDEGLWFPALQHTKFGSPEFPRCVVVEGEMELENGRNNKGGVKLPYIRCFDLQQKRYVYVDAADTKGYEFNSGAADSIVLPENIKGILHKVFHADVDQLFGDVVKGKHGGMVVLAHGAPGVGKTMTAETFAEIAMRPLYSMDVGELGIKLETIEQNLLRIFKRATRWNAVLLLDEADIFMAHRDSTSIERSAIVGVFLRLLDYFPGMLFLTTNRASHIDPAFLSRVTLKLNYPDLDDNARLTIWRSLLQASGMHLAAGVDGTEAHFEAAMRHLKVNGRQIKNIVRLLKVLHPTGVITTADIVEVAKFSEDTGIDKIKTV